jgi:transcriptional regulator with XRE-family HTH domain
MDRKQRLGLRLKELRKLRKLSQEELAERASISTQYVSNIERGKENPTLDLLFKLAGALTVSLAEMCDFEAEGVNQKQMEQAIREMLRAADPERLRIALKALKAILR